MDVSLLDAPASQPSLDAASTPVTELLSANVYITVP